MVREDLTQQGIAPAAGNKADLNPAAIAMLVGLAAVLLFALLRVVRG